MINRNVMKVIGEFPVEISTFFALAILIYWQWDHVNFSNIKRTEPKSAHERAENIAALYLVAAHYFMMAISLYLCIKYDINEHATKILAMECIFLILVIGPLDINFKVFSIPSSYVELLILIGFQMFFILVIVLILHEGKTYFGKKESTEGKEKHDENVEMENKNKADKKMMTFPKAATSVEEMKQALSTKFKKHPLNRSCQQAVHQTVKSLGDIYGAIAQVIERNDEHGLAEGARAVTAAETEAKSEVRVETVVETEAGTKLEANTNPPT